MIRLTQEPHPMFGMCCVMHDNEPMPKDDKGHVDVEEVKKIIECDMPDVVDLGHNISAWVDDEGLLKPKPYPNWIATALRTIHWTSNADDIACPCSYPPLCGNVVLLGGVDGDGNQLDLTDEQVNYITNILKKGN